MDSEFVINKSWQALGASLTGRVSKNFTLKVGRITYRGKAILEMDHGSVKHFEVYPIGARSIPESLKIDFLEAARESILMQSKDSLLNHPASSQAF